MKRLWGKPAAHDGRCPLCKQMILGTYGKDPHGEAEETRAIAGGEEYEYAHPLDLIDQIVKLPEGWVHVECAREAGHEVTVLG